jgi:hypothetical protein
MNPLNFVNIKPAVLKPLPIAGDVSNIAALRGSSGMVGDPKALYYNPMDYGSLAWH